MKKQSMKSRMHEHLGAKHPGPHKQSMAKRTKESMGMEKAMHHAPSHAIGDHKHHKKMIDHHHKEMKKHMDHMMKCAMKKHKAK